MSMNLAGGSSSTADASAGTVTSADAAPAKRRPGRPRMKDSLPADPNDNSRRSRMRLAQRSYRSRKENELATTKARADALQRALNSSLDEFIRFHELSSGKERELPSDFVLQLNKTAMNIMAIARSAQADDWLAASMGGDAQAASHASYHGKDNNNNNNNNNNTDDDDDDSGSIYILRPSSSRHGSDPRLRPKPVTISQRLIRACVDRAADTLHLTTSPVMCLLPAMLLPLQFDRRDKLLARTLRYLSIDDADLALDHEHSPPAARHLPRMLRLVEGRGETLVPRAAPPGLQRLRFGRTRTVLSTALPDLQGEWLEASDVEEYLEQRGIFIRQDAPHTDVLNLAIPVDAGLALQATDLDDANRQNPVRMVRNHPLFVDASSMPIPPPPPPPHHHQQQQGLPPMSMPGYHQQQPPPLDNFAVNPDYTIFGQQRDAQVAPSGMRMFTPMAWSIDDSPIILPMDMAMRSSNHTNHNNNNNPDHINIMVNLDNLIVKLASKAVCLGPCPGIRRGHVDEAIRDSVVQMPPM
ncbi:hypothetical protein J3F83DRAFT_771680 [Trichoderma novae-zelandiae]